MERDVEDIEDVSSLGEEKRYYSIVTEKIL